MTSTPERCKCNFMLMAIRVSAPGQQEMTCVRQQADAAGGYVYTASGSASRPSERYTPHVIPRFDGVAIPLEDSRILWQR